jgi:hypothetical protein
MEGYIHRLRQTLPASLEPFDEPVGQVAGFSLPAGVAAKAHPRQKLERLRRDISRPAVSEQRLSLTPNGNAQDAVPRWHHPCHLRAARLHRPARRPGA